MLVHVWPFMRPFTVTDSLELHTLLELTDKARERRGGEEREMSSLFCLHTDSSQRGA